MKRHGALLAAAGLAGACAYVGFDRGLSPNEIVLQQEIRAYFNEMQEAFAAGNAQAFAGLFDPSISRPLSRDQIQARAEAFFAENKTAHLRIDHLTFEELGRLGAAVTASCRVEPQPGRHALGAVERATLVKRRGRWYVASWEEASKP